MPWGKTHRWGSIVAGHGAKGTRNNLTGTVLSINWSINYVSKVCSLDHCITLPHYPSFAGWRAGAESSNRTKPKYKKKKPPHQRYHVFLTDLFFSPYYYCERVWLQGYYFGKDLRRKWTFWDPVLGKALKFKSPLRFYAFDMTTD